MARIPRAAKWVLLVVGACAVVAFGAAVLLTETDSGKNWLKVRVEQAVSKAIPGSFRIGALTDLGPPVLARDVRFYHPDGRMVLSAELAEVEFDLWQALQGRLAFERAAVDGGSIVLSLDPDGRVAFEAAVDAPRKPGEPEDPHGGLHYALQSMHVQNFKVIMKLADAANYTVHDVQGFVAVRRIETSGTRVLLEDIRGRVEPGLLDKRTELLRVDGWIHGKERQVMQLNAKLRIGDGRLDTLVNYFDRDKTPAEITIKKAEGAGELISALLSLAETLFGDTLEVDVKD